jgi:glycosyltransferase involved in cell wall biosynthesis
MNGPLFISWAPFCSRSDNIARELGGRSVMIYHAFWGSHYATVGFKYLTQAIATLLVLLRLRPRRVFVMSPPIVACLPVWLYAKLAGAAYVIDAHTATFVDTRWRTFEFVARFLARHAVTTLVTNRHWQAVVEEWGARCDIVTDVPVQFPEPQALQLPGGDNVAVVCTYTFDEPVDAMFEAASLVPQVSFHFTGNPARVPPPTLARKPANVRLTGFLPAAEYAALLRHCTAVMSLTTLDHTMQRGAYEAAYLGRPIITSDFELLRNSFPKGAVFVDGTPQSIASGVRALCANAGRYESEAAELNQEKRRRWEQVREHLQRML